MKHMSNGFMGSIPESTLRYSLNNTEVVQSVERNPRKRYLAVDHCHTCGAIRGLLCFFCNSALGVWEFDPDTAQRASEYLDRVRQDLLSHPLVEAKSLPEMRDDLPF